ncbi:MAG: TraB/GumN family protein [Sphaerochaetaceae bacterium]|nr:TraB/GumN family protein [Sphaerochaetaceae bacterium]NLY08041.1 TraB/GumN family protein [Spirochaetales bacterium]
MKTEIISDTIKKIQFENGMTITLVGTAHVSQESVGEVAAVIDEVKPDRICLELDSGRFEARTKAHDYSSMNLSRVFKEGKAFLILANTALASFQKRIGEGTGVAPGEEILQAARIAKDKDIPYSLCDREISITLKRAWALSNLWNKCKLIATLISSAFSKEKVTAEELEELKHTDTLQSMMQELSKELPGAKKALIDERDRYLATSIFAAPGNNKVAVIGAGHAEGIIVNMEKLEKGEMSKDLSDISSTPKKGNGGKIASFVVPALIIGVIVYGFIAKGWNQGLFQFGLWAAANAGCTLIFAIIFGAHPLNWLISAVSAPFAALNPVIGVGVFSGIAESELRKPRVRDFENLSDDAGTFKGWFKNRFLHALMLFVTTSIGSIIGTFAVFPILLAAFG